MVDQTPCVSAPCLGAEPVEMKLGVKISLAEPVEVKLGVKISRAEPVEMKLGVKISWAEPVEMKLGVEILWTEREETWISCLFLTLKVHSVQSQAPVKR